MFKRNIGKKDKEEGKEREDGRKNRRGSTWGEGGRGKERTDSVHAPLTHL